MYTKMFSWTSSDFIKGLITAVFGAVIMTLAGIAQQPGFNIATVDWNTILQVAIGSFLGYVSKNFFTSTTPTTEKVMGVALPPPTNAK